jgi:chlorosome envelope protein J
MIISINDRPCQARVGDMLLNTAKQNRAHIGYLCGGNGICQSCFVYVLEGADCLSSPGEDEKAFISDRLFSEGGRLACRTTIVREGPIRLLTRAEHLRRVVLGLNVPGFISYARTIGDNVVSKLPSGAGSIVARIQEGRIDPVSTLGKIASGLGPASLLLQDSFISTFPFMQTPFDMVGSTVRGALGTASGLMCAITGGRLKLPGSTCCTDDAEPATIERITIRAQP